MGATLSATLASLIVPVRARAAEPEVALRWSAPAGCPDEAALLRKVRGLVSPLAGLEAVGTMSRTDGRYHVVLRVTTGVSVGERELEGDSCAALADSAAVVLALSATQPEPAPPSPPPLPPPFTPAVPVTPAPVSVSPPPKTPEPPPRRRTTDAPTRAPRGAHIRVGAVFALDIGTLPKPAFGGGLDVALVAGHNLLLALKGTLWASDSGSLSTLTPSAGARFGLFTADGDGCYGFRVRRFELSPCVMVEVAHLWATGFLATTNQSATATWLGLGAGGRARWELTGTFALGLELGGMVPTQGQTFVIKQENGTNAPVHVVGPLAFRGALGPEVRF